MNEYSNASPWGAWHESIADGLASAADYLSRCQRSLAGEIAPDRFYFADKARALRDAAIALVRRCHEVERWLGECGTDIETTAVDGGAVFWATCALPSGHDGPHDDSPPSSPALRADQAFEMLHSEAVQVGDTIAWAAVRTDPAAEDVTEALDQARAKLIEVGRRAVQLAEELGP